MQASKPTLLTRDSDHLIHPLHSPKAHKQGHVWIGGTGSVLVDADGREYIDGLSGLWNVAIGHGREELGLAAQGQMQQLAYCSGYAGSSNPRAIELAEKTRLAGLSVDHAFLLHVRRRRVQRDQLQAGPFLLEDPRAS